MNRELSRRLMVMLACLMLMVGLGMFSGCRGKVTPGTEPTTYKIGADFTLTGATAYWSQQLRKGMDLAIDEANQSGGSRLEVVYEDNQSNPTTGVTAFNKLVSVDKVSLVMSCFTPVSKPLRTLAGQQQVPFLATVTSALDFGIENEWSFRDFPPQDQQATALAEYAYQKLGLRKVSSLTVTDDYGRDGLKAFSAEFKRLGGQILDGATIDQKAADGRSQVTKALSGSPDGILMIVRDKLLGQSVSQALEMGFKGKMIGVNAFDATPVWQATGSAGDGCVFTSAYVDWKDPQTQTFAQAFKAKSNEDPDWVVLYGYTIAQYCAQIIRSAQGDRAKVRDGLASLNVPSIRGKLVMSPKREVLGPIGVYERKDGKNVLLEKIEPTVK